MSCQATDIAPIAIYLSSEYRNTEIS